MRGHWWSPDAATILAQRTDESAVQRWLIGDPANPDVEPQVVAYPAAGTPNASVTLWLIGLDGTRTPVYFDDEYLTEVTWDRHALTITTMTRQQGDLRVWVVDPTRGTTRLVWSGGDSALGRRPARTADAPGDGSPVWLVDAGDTRSLAIGGTAVTPASCRSARSPASTATGCSSERARTLRRSGSIAMTMPTPPSSA